MSAGGQRIEADHSGLQLARRRHDLDRGLAVADRGVGLGEDAGGLGVRGRRRRRELVHRRHGDGALDAGELGGVQILHLHHHEVVAGAQVALEQERELRLRLGAGHRLGGREVELVAEAVEEPAALEQLAGDHEVVGAVIGELRHAGVGGGYGDHSLEHRPVLIAAGEVELHLRREQGGAVGDVGRVGAEGGHPFAAGTLGPRFEAVLEDGVVHVLGRHPADARGDLVAVARTALGDLDDRVPAPAAGRGAAFGEQHVEAFQGVPEPEEPGAPALVEDHHELLAHLVAAGVVPDLQRPEDRGAGRDEHRDRGAVEEEDLDPFVVEVAAPLRARLLDAGLPAVAELVARRGLVLVARLPEAVDERVPLIVLVQGEEGGPLVVGHQELDLFEPLLVLLGELRDGLLLGLLNLLALRPGRFLARSADPGEKHGEESGGEQHVSEKGRRAAKRGHRHRSTSRIKDWRARAIDDLGPRRRRTINRLMHPVYLDHNATTPLHPQVREAMLPWLGERHGNPSSIHAFGQAARNAVEEARERVAALIGARPPEVVFTASGTEGNNAVIFGEFRRGGSGGHLVISSIEHPSVREAAARLEREGMAVTRVSPGPDGVVPVSGIADALRPDTRLVCLMLANNELGTLQPVAEVAAICRERGVPVLCDAVQAVGKIPVDVGGAGGRLAGGGRAQVPRSARSRGGLGAEGARVWRPARGRQPGAPPPGEHGERAGARRLRSRRGGRAVRAARAAVPSRRPP